MASASEYASATSRHARGSGVGSCVSLSLPGVRGYKRHGACAAASPPMRESTARVTAHPSSAPANHTASCPPARARSRPAWVRMLSYSSSASHRYPLIIAASALTLTTRSEGAGLSALLFFSPKILLAVATVDLRGTRRISEGGGGGGGAAPRSVSRGVSSSSRCAT